MTDQAFDLRVAGPADAAGLLELIHAAFGAREAVVPPAAALSDSIDDVRSALEAAPGVVAVSEGRLIGGCLVQIDGDVATLSRVCVLPGFEGQGVAAAVVRGAGDIAVELGARTVEIMCRREFPQTQQWWQSHGFAVVRDHELGSVLSRQLSTRVVVPTAEAMQDLGERLAGLLRKGDVVISSGDLGAGKTTMTQGIGRGLDVDGPVISPTFVISRVHHNRGDGPDLVHVDAYRLSSEAELFDLDLDDTLADSVTLVEWGAGLAEGLGRSVLDIDIRRSADPSDETRVVYLTGYGERWADVDLHALSTASGDEHPEDQS